MDKPDGWYLPNNGQDVAIIIETKASGVDINSQKCITELQKNCSIISEKYSKYIGILYNGSDVLIFKNGVLYGKESSLSQYTVYIDLFMENGIDKQEIYRQTAKINNLLHTDFGIKNLYERMIFTACALVAQRYDAKLEKIKGMGYNLFTSRIRDVWSKSFAQDKNQNSKLNILLDVYSEVRMNYTNNQEAIDQFIDAICSITNSLTSNHWRGEDVMGIFFNEFNRYKKKSESGQVFTPNHITSFMYRLIGVNKSDYLLDATCGSGAFLVKAMGNMMAEAGGQETLESQKIKSEHLYGIEFDREIFALACANMLIHKDGKTNLEHLDTRTDKAKEWIKDKPITKVLMNPPYETKYGCLEIVNNVLESVK